MKFVLPKIFSNKYFLYLTALFSIGNVMGYLAKEKYESVSFFLAVGLLSSYFSKNMSVVLLIALITTTIFSYNTLTEGFKEGVKTAEEKEEKKIAESEAVEAAAAEAIEEARYNALTTEEKEKEDAAKKVAEKAATATATVTTATTLKTPPPATHATEDAGIEITVAAAACSVFENDKWAKPQSLMNETVCRAAMKTDIKKTCWGTIGKDGACIAAAEGYANMKKKSATESREARVDGVDETVGDRIDYANTMKQSMNNLQDMLGADGMKGLASETKRLVSQQKELVDSLGQMAPVLNSAKSTLDSLNLPDMKGITNILATLKGGK